jgi:hypothetical protein
MYEPRHITDVPTEKAFSQCTPVWGIICTAPNVKTYCSRSLLHTSFAMIGHAFRFLYLQCAIEMDIGTAPC